MSNFLIAPDFSPENFAGWHMFNTLLQKRSGHSLHLITPVSHDEQQQILAEQDIALVYANPFDAAELIRERGFRPLARPVGKMDEMVITSSSKGDIASMEDIPAKTSVAITDNRDVKLIGLRLLEAVDIAEDDIEFTLTENYQAAARNVIQAKTDLAFFMAETFASLSRLTKTQLNVLIESDLSAISHVVLVKDGFEHAEELQKVMLSLKEDEDGRNVLSELGIPEGFEVLEEEDAEFMIDLMETLLS